MKVIGKVLLIETENATITDRIMIEHKAPKIIPATPVRNINANVRTAELNVL